MVRKTLLALALVLVAAVVCISIGHGIGKQRQTLAAQSPRLAADPGILQTLLPQSSSTPEAADQQYAHRLPGMECLVDQRGIRRKVIITRRGVHCIDRAPGGTAMGPELKFFMPYFVFAVVPTVGDVEFFQIGPTPQKSSILGWVAAADAATWDTRVGARYLRNETARVPPLLVYDSYAACEELIKTGVTSAKPIARTSSAGRRAWMPWPIAETRMFTFKGKVHETLRLQFLGATKGNFEPAASSPGQPQAVYSDGEIAKIKGNVRRLDLVFVIDTTLSMTPAIASTIQAVELICQRLHDLPFQPDLNFGLVEYRDFVKAIMFKNEGKLSPVKVYPLQSDLDAFLATIRHLKAATDSSEDWPEAVFDGVHAALQQTAWRGDRLSARAIILIGDNSAHEPGHPKNPENISADELINLARERQTNVKIFSLCIEGDGGEEEQALHKAQFTKLADGAGGKCYSFHEAAKVVDQIRAIMESETATVHKRSIVVEALASGKTSEQIVAERQASAPEVTEVMEFLQGAGVDVARLRPGVPAFATGWCLSEVEDVPLLEKEVYVARSELDRLLSELNELCVHLAPDFAKQAFQAGLGSRVANPLSFFADYRPEPMDVYLMAKGVPCSQGLLRLSRAEIEHMPEEQRAILREKIARQVVPQLTNARNNSAYFTWLNDLEFGWIPESLFP